MKIGSVGLHADNRFEIDFDLMQKLGFETIDIGIFMTYYSPIYRMNDDEFKIYLLDLKSELEKHNLIPWQLHSLWNYEMYAMDEEESFDKTILYYERAMRGAQILGTKYVVLHHRFPFGYGETEETKKYGYQNNLNFIKRLIPIAEKYDVVLCLENLPFYTNYSKINETIRAIDEINSPHLKMCLDTGHYNCVDTNLDIYSTILKIGNRLKVLHVHDNLGGDHHLLPGQGSIDWDNFFKGLKDINFDGSISFECCSRKEDKTEFYNEEKAMIEFVKKHL